MYRIHIVLIALTSFVSPSLIAGESMVTWKRELIAADKAAAEAASTSDIDRILATWTEDAIISFPGRPNVVGKKAIKQMILANRAQPGFQITWSPSNGHVSGSNDLGYTFGTFRVTRSSPDGKKLMNRGKYICVWKKVEGHWKCAHEVAQIQMDDTESKTTASND